MRLPYRLTSGAVVDLTDPSTLQSIDWSADVAVPLSRLPFMGGHGRADRGLSLAEISAAMANCAYAETGDATAAAFNLLAYAHRPFTDAPDAPQLAAIAWMSGDPESVRLGHARMVEAWMTQICRLAGLPDRPPRPILFARAEASAHLQLLPHAPRNAAAAPLRMRGAFACHPPGRAASLWLERFEVYVRGRSAATACLATTGETV